MDESSDSNLSAPNKQQQQYKVESPHTAALDRILLNGDEPHDDSALAGASPKKQPIDFLDIFDATDRQLPKKLKLADGPSEKEADKSNRRQNTAHVDDSEDENAEAHSLVLNPSYKSGLKVAPDDQLAAMSTSTNASSSSTSQNKRKSSEVDSEPPLNPTPNSNSLDASRQMSYVSKKNKLNSIADGLLLMKKESSTHTNGPSLDLDVESAVPALKIDNEIDDLFSTAALAGLPTTSTSVGPSIADDSSVLMRPNHGKSSPLTVDGFTMKLAVTSSEILQASSVFVETVSESVMHTLKFSQVEKSNKSNEIFFQSKPFLPFFTRKG